MLIASGDESAGASSGTNGGPQQPFTNNVDEDDGGDDSSEESSPLRSPRNGSGAGTGYRVTVYARQCLSTTNLDQLQHEGCTTSLSKGKGAEKLAVREPERSPPGMLGASNYSYECRCASNRMLRRSTTREMMKDSVPSPVVMSSGRSVFAQRFDRIPDVHCVECLHREGGKVYEGCSCDLVLFARGAVRLAVDTFKSTLKSLWNLNNIVTSLCRCTACIFIARFPDLWKLLGLCRCGR